MLEGTDQRGRYLITLDVSSYDDEQAVTDAAQEATKLGLMIVGVEECECRGTTENLIGLVKVYGKAYFAVNE